MNVVARFLISMIDTATEATDTAIETVAKVITKKTAKRAAEKTAEKTTERTTEKTAEKTTEKTTEKAARLMMMLKIESELMTLKIKMIDIDDISDFENPSLKHVKLII